MDRRGVRDDRRCLLVSGRACAPVLLRRRRMSVGVCVGCALGGDVAMLRVWLWLEEEVS